MKYFMFLIILISCQVLAVATDDEFEDDWDPNDGHSYEYYFNQPHYSSSINHTDEDNDLIFVLINHSGDVYGLVAFANGNLSVGNYSTGEGTSFDEWIISNWNSVNWFIIDQMNP